MNIPRTRGLAPYCDLQQLSTEEDNEAIRGHLFGVPAERSNVVLDELESEPRVEKSRVEVFIWD